jgi:hypothetical protein
MAYFSVSFYSRNDGVKNQIVEIKFNQGSRGAYNDFEFEFVSRCGLRRVSSEAALATEDACMTSSASDAFTSTACMTSSACMTSDACMTSSAFDATSTEDDEVAEPIMKVVGREIGRIAFLLDDEASYRERLAGVHGAGHLLRDMNSLKDGVRSGQFAYRVAPFVSTDLSDAEVVDLFFEGPYIEIVERLVCFVEVGECELKCMAVAALVEGAKSKKMDVFKKAATIAEQSKSELVRVHAYRLSCLLV